MVGKTLGAAWCLQTQQEKKHINYLLKRDLFEYCNEFTLDVITVTHVNSSDVIHVFELAESILYIEGSYDWIK